MMPKLNRSVLDQSATTLRLLFFSVAVALGYLGTAAEPSLSQNAPYYCAQLHREWHTFIRLSDRKDPPILTWRTRYFGLSPYDRCQQVSDRFNNFLASRSLREVRSGWYNNLPVLCVGSCGDGEILFTLEPWKSAEDARQQLRTIVDQAFVGRSIVNSDSFLESDKNGDVILHWNDMVCEMDNQRPECY